MISIGDYARELCTPKRLSEHFKGRKRSSVPENRPHCSSSTIHKNCLRPDKSQANLANRDWFMSRKSFYDGIRKFKLCLGYYYGYIEPVLRKFILNEFSCHVLMLIKRLNPAD